MSLFLTPSHFARRGEFHRQLGQLTAAGVPLVRALETQLRSPPHRGYRPPLRVLLRRLEEGATFSDALAATGRWVTEFDLALLRAGETSGRLPNIFSTLASHYDERARLLRETLSNLAYPAFLFHFAILLGPLPELVQSGNVLAYAGKIGVVFAPVYLAVALLAWAAQGRHGERWRAFLEQVVRAIPLAGAARRDLALARLCAALEALLTAGVGIIDAWELAADACGSPALRRVVRRWRPQLESGATPAELVGQSPEFPATFASLYATGEVSGTLDDSLRQLRALHHESGSHRLRTLSEWLPKIVYLAIVLMIAWRVVSFYTGYFGQINQVIQ
jgi:type II secretory pathway component PulF